VWQINKDISFIRSTDSLTRAGAYTYCKLRILYIPIIIMSFFTYNSCLSQLHLPCYKNVNVINTLPVIKTFNVCILYTNGDFIEIYEHN
jgi:hypothetical protein